MLYKIRILTAAFLICGTKCSQVVDIHTQKGLNISDYCPQIGECGEGSHVMCVYNSTRIMGPTCYDFLTNVTITTEYAQLILGIINRIRSRIANGLVKAKDGLTLPKGYGLHRVVWDEELATFAQVWANQCELRLDLCRSSKKFPHVGQALGMTRLSLDDWMPIHKNDFDEETLTTEKVKYALRSVIKAWWSMKEGVTADDVKEYNQSAASMLRNKFLNMVYGPLTHVGCGISVYKEYAYKDHMAHLFFNCIQVVCNFSARPKRPIYMVEPPTQPGYTARCGCPIGYDEDEDCLCYESGRKMPCKDKDQCKPSVVVLPIFTAEDVSISPPRDLTRRFPTDVKSRYFNKVSKMTLTHNTRSAGNMPYARRRYSKQKQSIFSKAGIFELPIKRKQVKMNRIHQSKEYKKDVAPRKDFTNFQKLASRYLDKKKNGIPFIVDINSDGDIIHGPVTFRSNQAKNVKMNSSITTAAYEIHKTNLANEEVEYSTVHAQPDVKLMSLLDKLEEEVKRIDLNTSEKELFDEKIRKIYGTLVGKPSLVKQKLKPKSKESFNQSIVRDSDQRPNLINADNYEYNLNQPKYNYRDFEKKYNSLMNYENEIDRMYNKNKYYNNGKSFLHENIDERKLRNTYDVREEFKRHKANRHSRLEGHDYYPLSSERRRYYHQKLANLQKQINNMKRSGHRKEGPEGIRHVRPTMREKKQLSKRLNDQVNTYYMPGRARFLHGF